MSAPEGDADGEYGGLVHAVESAEDITGAFCLDVVAGVLDVEPLKMRGREVSQGGAEGNRKYLAEVKEKWSTYDWTQYVV